MTTNLLIEGAGETSGFVRVEGDAYRHLFRARRLAAGDAVRVVDGKGGAWSARVASVGRSSAEIEVVGPVTAGEPARRLEVWAAPPKIGRAAWMVEKLTELGATAIHFCRAERSAREYGDGNLERLRRVARAAVEQSGRSVVPAVTGVCSWEETLAGVARAPEVWLLDAASGTSAPVARESLLALLVGPEGGWTPRDLEGILPLVPERVSLGATTLRTETAAVAGAALALAEPAR